MNSAKNFVFSLVLIVVSVALCLIGAEIVLRAKNASMTNYDIEMWRYANELKQKSADPAIDFDHVRSKSALLQNTEIRVNEWGLARSAPRADAVRRATHSVPRRINHTRMGRARRIKPWKLAWSTC